MALLFDKCSPATKAMLDAKFREKYGKSFSNFKSQPTNSRHRTQPIPGKMNKLEERYAEVLKYEKMNGTILDFGFQRMKFKLAGNTFYTPDFDVVKPDFVVELHETKGFWEEDARIKIKVAAQTFWQFKWIGVKWVNKTWEFEEF